MNFILKKFGKKAVSLVCAIAIILSVVTVAFGTFASDPAVSPYVVKMSSPAIPMTALTKINLDNIDVVFPGDSSATDGTEINWAVDAAASIISLKGTELIAFSKGTAKLTATKKSGGEAVNIYAVVKNPADTSWDIYAIDFTSVDDEYQKLGHVNGTPDTITYNGTAISATNPAPEYPAGWKSYFLTPVSGSKQFCEFHTVMPYIYNDGTALKFNTGLVPFGVPQELYSDIKWGNSGYFVLNNEVVNAFADYTITTRFLSQGGQGQNAHTKFVLAGRVALNADGTPKLDSATNITGLGIQIHSTCDYSGHDGVYAPDAVTLTATLGTEPIINITTAGVSAATTQVWNTSEMSGVKTCLKYQSCGRATTERDITLSVKYDGATATLFSPNDTTQSTFKIDSAQKAGAVAFAQDQLDTWLRQTMSSLQNFKVALNNDPTNPNDYPAYSTDLGAYVVNQTSPAIPMNFGTKISTADLLIEDENGNLIAGDTLTFENVSGDNNAIVIDNANDTITAYKKGAFKVKVTKGSTEVSTAYVVVKYLSDTEWVLYEKSFGEEEYKNLAYVDPDGIDATAISSSNRVNYPATYNNDYITYNGTKISATNKVAFPSGWNSYFTGYAEYTYDANGFATGNTTSNFGFHEYPSVMPYVNKLSGRNVTGGIVPFENAYTLGYRTAPQYPTAFNSYFVLNNEVVNAFSDYTVNADLNGYGAAISTGEQITVGVVGRVQLDNSGKLVSANAASVSGLTVRLAKYDQSGGEAAVFNSTLTATGSTSYTEVNGSNGDTIWDYVQDKHPHYYSKFAQGVNLNMSVKYQGENATLFSNLDANGETFSTLSSEQKGTIAIALTGQGASNNYYRNSSWVSVNSVKVTLNNSAGECPKYTDLGLYSVDFDEPAIPMYAGSYIWANSIAIEDAAGNVYIGNTVKLESVSGSNGLTIDNTTGRITAYTKGVYEIAVKDAATDALLTTVYVVVKNKGDATWDIYSIKFGEEEYKKLTYVDPDNIHTEYKWDNTAYLGDETNDYIALNGNKVTSASNGVAFPSGWTSYFTKSDGTLGTYPTVMPYSNFVTGRATSGGIVPFEVPARIGLDNLPLVDGKQYFSFRQTNAYFILNNKTVNAFANYTVTTNLDNYTAWGTEDGNGARFTVGIVGRVQYDAQGNVPTDSSAIFNGFTVNPGDKQNSTRGTVYVHAGTVGAATGNSAVGSNYYWNYLTGLGHNASTMQANGVNMTLKTVFDGDSMELSSPLDKEGIVYTAANTKQKGGVGITLTGLSCWEGSRKTSWTNIKTVTVSLNNVDGECPAYTEFDYFATKESPYIYGTVGDKIDIADVVVEIGNTFAVGDTLSWTPMDNKASVSGNEITLNEKGVATVKVSDGTSTLNVIFAIKGVGEEFFSNGNYAFDYETGAITAIKPLDSSSPYSTVLTIPDRFTHADGKWTNIYEISANAGANSGAYNINLQKLTIGKYIESIGASAFEGATALREIELPERLKVIGENAFKKTALTEITIPVRTDKIGAGAFADCTSLAKVYIGNPDIEIGEGAFSSGTVVYGPVAIKNAVEAAGGQFAELDQAEVSAAAALRASILTIEANRINVTDTKAVFYAEWKGETYGYYITDFNLYNRDAGKIEITTDMKLVVDGKLVSADGNIVSPSGMFKNSVDTRAVENIVYGAGTSVYGNQMADLTSLKSVTLPENLSSTGHNLLRGCTGLTEVTIPANVEFVGMDIFNDCTSLEKIIIPENSKLSRFGYGGFGDPQRAWMQNTAVKEIYLPVTVTELTPAVFGTTGIEKITITNKNAVLTTTDTNDKLFPNNTVVYGVKGSTAEEYVNKTKSKYGYTFVAIDDFYTVKANAVDSNAQFTVELIDGTYYAVTGYTGIGGKIIIPAYANATDGVKNAPIYAVSAEMFQTAENGPRSIINRLIGLEVSEGVYEISEDAFKGATYLKSVKLPVSLKVIGKTSFANAGLSGKVEIPKNVSEIGAGAFQGNAGITDMYIYNAATVIKGAAIDKTVKIHGIAGSTAEEYAKKNGNEFVAISAPSAEKLYDVSDNGNYVFTVENGIITGYARKDASKPYSRKVTIPEKVGGVKITGIGEGLFEQGAEASSVYAVTIADSITEIGNKAFYNAVALTYIDFGKGVTMIGDSAFEGTALKGDLELPENIATLGTNAFKGVKTLNSITVLNKACVLKANSIPRVNPNFVLIGYSESTAAEFAEKYKIAFDAIDGTDDPNNDPTDKDNTGSVKDPADDIGGENNSGGVGIFNDLTLIIVIAVAAVLLTLVIGAAVVVIIVIKSRRSDDDEDE